MAKRIVSAPINVKIIGAGLIIFFSLSMTLQYFWNATPLTIKKTPSAGAAVSVPDFSDATTRLSRSDITAQIVRLTEQMADLEKTEAVHGPMGTIIYSAETTGHLARDYQQIQLRVGYLASGQRKNQAYSSNINWGDYVLKSGVNRSFSVAEIEKSLSVLEQYPWASNFLAGFRIFALPFTIPDVSGLGGAGFSLLSAADHPGDSQSSLDEQLRVTLFHEMGHHLHLSTMPDDTAAGQSLWREYLSLRGGTWHGPGKVKTAGWSNSSEETFAEDFRMLFGKDQPYYGDVALGDPRSNSAVAAQIRNFMAGLAKKPAAVSYQSPWMPSDAVFWVYQPLIIAGVWALLGAGAITIDRLESKRRKRINAGFDITRGV